jgi:pimeloyl-ACP methyl ester carboxylesterase
MVRKVDLRLDVSGAEAVAGEAYIAATAFLPDQVAEPAVVVFASPGGGYARGYFDLRFEGRDGYSQAEHHTARGMIFVAYDHLGVGDSSIAGLAEMTIEDIAAADHAAVTKLLERIRRGALHASLPALPHVTAIGHGQSMGGGVSIIMQGRHRSFDAISPVGYSAIHTMLPQRTAEATERARQSYMFDRQTAGAELSAHLASAEVEDFVYPFHWEDIPADILKADMAGGYPLRRTSPVWGSLTIPNCVVAMMSPGYVKAEAAAIDTPVFLGFGERDTSGDMHAEPSAFPNSPDVSLFIVPTMAHMHNFASTRRRLWDRHADWAATVARARAAA